MTNITSLQFMLYICYGVIVILLFSLRNKYDKVLNKCDEILKELRKLNQKEQD